MHIIKRRGHRCVSHWNLKSLFWLPFCNGLNSQIGKRIPETLRPRPHVSGHFSFRIPLSSTLIHWIRPVNPKTFESALQSENFWIRYPDISFRIRVEGRIRIPSNPMTLQDRVQSLQSSRPRGYRTTWRPNKRSCCSCWEYFQSRNMCWVTRSYVDCAF